jgi:putative DNA primase/helicase
MPLKKVAAICQKIAAHNQEVKLLSQFWELLLKTKTGEFARSPFLDLQKAAGGVYMVWSDDIHDGWRANTYIMDATMNDKIVQRFYPQMHHSLVDNKKPSPHTYIKQIADQRFSKKKFVPDKSARPKDQTTQRNNLELVRRVLEVTAREIWPGETLVICQQAMETALMDIDKLPQRTDKVTQLVDLEHFNNHKGRNDWRDARGLITVGRTEPGVRDVERRGRALFGVDISEIEPDASGVPLWPLADERINLRDGTSVVVQISRHPDPHVHAVWQQICQAELIQAIGRGRGADRTEANPLLILIMGSVPLPITVDEVVAWKDIQPSFARIMWARGAVPVSYRDMAAAYPDLFVSQIAAKRAMQREMREWERRQPQTQNRDQTPIDIDYLIGVWSRFSLITYRRPGSRGPAGRLFYDPTRIDPTVWLAEHLGATVTTESVRRERGGVPMVEVLVDGKARRVIDFNNTVGSA